MGNSLLTDSIITKECLMELKNQLTFTKSMNRQYDDKFANSGAKVGDTINIRKPARYVANDGPTLIIQDSQDESVPMTLDQHKHVGMAFSQKDLTLSIDAFKDRYIKPAITTLANAVDYYAFSTMYKKVPQSVGVPSASAFPSTLKGFTQGKAKMATLGAPVDDLTACVDPLVEASLVEGLKGLFQSSEQIKNQYEKGVMGIAAGAKFKMSQNVPKHLSGAPVGSPAIKTTVSTQGQATIDADGITGSITGCYKEGDVITIGGVYAVNPQTKQSTGELKQFVVTATTNSVSNEIASLPISPAIYTTGAYQNVDAFPVDGAAIQLFGHASSYGGLTVPQNMLYHPDAFVLGCADIVLPKGMAMAARASDPDSGLSIALVRGFDIVNYREITRLDIIFGVKCIYPEYACRVVGQPA